MKKMVALTLALLMAASLFLSGCSVRKDTSDSENSGSSNGSGSGDRVVNVCSWGEYIDESLIDQFEEATGIKVNYQTAESNEVLYSQLSMGGVDYDVIVPSDYMISQLIEEDMLAELNYDNIPNFEKIDDRFKNLSYDPENKDEAEEWINFLCSTDASLKNMDYIWYASPNKEALEQYPEYYEETYGEELDPELYEIMAAPQEVLKNCEAYLVRPAATRTLYNDLWTDLGILA